jgi:hypothetical protein
MMRLLASTGARVPSGPRSKRKVATDHFHEQIRRSNEFHVAYLEDARILRSYGRFAHWQLEYLLPLLFGNEQCLNLHSRVAAQVRTEAGAVDRHN